MTREEEIRKEAYKHREMVAEGYESKGIFVHDEMLIDGFAYSFADGAVWADSHPASPETAGNQPIDWEQRRYEIARDVLPQVVQMSASYKEEHVGNNTTNKQVTIEGPRVAMLAVGFADCLVEELRKTEHHGEH